MVVSYVTSENNQSFQRWQPKRVKLQNNKVKRVHTVAIRTIVCEVNFKKHFSAFCVTYLRNILLILSALLRTFPTHVTFILKA